MSTTMDLFAAEEAKEAGMKLAFDNKSDLVGRVRYRLEAIARTRQSRTVSIDDAADFLAAIGESLGNAAGSVFKTGRWEPVGYEKSQKVSSHGRIVQRWRLK